MEYVAAADPSIDATDVAFTANIVATAPMSSTTTTANITKPKVKVKKEVTAAERGVQNQKRQARRVSERARKAHAFTTALEEEKWECLSIMDALAQA
jgi:hypothetical protein